MSRRLRWGLALGLSLLVHVLLLALGNGWQWSPGHDESPLKPLTVELHAQALKLPASPPPPKAAPRPRPPAIVTRAADTPPVAEEPAPAGTAATPPAEEAPEQDTPAPETAVPPPGERPFAPDPEQEARQQAEAFSRQFPPAARLTYEVYYGALLAGLAEFDWQQDNGRYRLEVRLRPVFGKRLGYLSEGRITAGGLTPDRFEARKGGELREQAEFDYQAGILRYGRDLPLQETALQAGAQDIVSVAFQIALRGAARRRLPNRSRSPPARRSTATRWKRWAKVRSAWATARSTASWSKARHAATRWNSGWRRTTTTCRCASAFATTTRPLTSA